MLLFPHYADSPDSDGSDGSTSWATFIGIVICLCGNVIISFALNIQRLAHERIQRKLAARHSRKQGSRGEREAEGYGNGAQSSGVSTGGDGITDEEDHQGTRYLHSPLWWTGLVLMVIGETGNFVACTTPCPRPVCFDVPG